MITHDLKEIDKMNEWLEDLDFDNSKEGQTFEIIYGLLREGN